MTLLDIFRKKDRDPPKRIEPEDTTTKDKASDLPSTEKKLRRGSTSSSSISSLSSDDSQSHPPSYNSHAPYPAGPAQPPANIVPTAQNAGMAVGGAGAVITDNSLGAGIVDGLVVGNIVGRTVQSAQNHAYWKDRQQQYLAGDETAAMGPSSRSKRQEKREQRRKERWARRAARAE
ncbi:hypothetical protein TWF694_006935 [Orbilia ellipsospora]|uniref:Uncharacterized protein n=1 Tax=Orbilia ellipsospora TaxID=2528407 RepID=A0AAV9XM34_9PEZI